MSSEPAVGVSHVSKTFTLGLTGKRDPLPTILKNRMRHPFAPRRQRERFQALDDVTFAVAPGEVVGVIGRNGAGKSTLLKILSRITYPTSGHVDIVGRVGSLLEVGTGFHPELTGMENIYLNGTVLGLSKREIDARIDEIVAFAEVDRFLETPVKRYSSGMRVRLAFAVAAHLEPEVLIIDEVLSVGDAAFQAKCIDKMRAIAGDDGRTVLYVSHNLVTVESLCPRSLLLTDGRLVFDGDTEATISQYMRNLPHAQRGRQVGEFDLGSADRNRAGFERILRRLEFRPNRGDLGDHVRMGSPVQVVIEVESLDAVPDAVVTVTVGSETIQQITRLTTRMVPLRAASARTARELIVLDLPELPLTPGEYHLDVRVAIDPRHGPGVLDEVLHAAEFTVDPADVLGNGYRFGPHDGPLTLPFDWEIRPAGPADAGPGGGGSVASPVRGTAGSPFAVTDTQLFLLGAAKSGTTTLATWLDGHPEVLLSKAKEPYFYELLYERGLDDYWQHCFAERWAGEPIVLDARHRNLFLPYVPERIEASTTNPRFLVILREPVARAESHWWHWRSRGREPLDFADAIRADWERIEAGIDFSGPDGPAQWARNYPERGPHYNGIETLLWRTYVDTGFYATQIARYTERFGADRVLVVFQDDLRDDPRGTARRIEEFVGIQPIDALPEHLNAGAAAATAAPAPKARRRRAQGPQGAPRPPIDASTRDFLTGVYREHNRALEVLLGRPLPSGWTTDDRPAQDVGPSARGV